MKNSDNKRLLVIRSCGKSGKYQFTGLSPRDLSEIGDESFDLPFLYPRPEISFNCYRDWICIYDYEGHFYLWNPTTKQCLFFPTEKLSAFDETRTSLLGACVCYDSESNEYRILRVCQGDFHDYDSADYRRSQTFELYSFRQDSWSEIPFDNLEDIYMSGFRATSVRGKVYWFNLCNRIVSLDCSKESLSYIDLPLERRPFELGELVQFNGGDSLGVVCMWDRHPKPGYDYELWVWSENPTGWYRMFSVSLGGSVGRPPGTICETFLFLRGMAGKPGADEHRLVAYDWTKKDCKEACKELGIHDDRSDIHVLCYVEGTFVLPHGKPINGSSFLINPHFVKWPERFLNCDNHYCNCNCHFVDIFPEIKIYNCECSQPNYDDAYRLYIEDFANGFRILSDTEEVGPDISNKQLALKPTAGNPDAQGGEKKKKKKKKKKSN